MLQKICNRCGIEKFYNSFSPLKCGKNGLNPKCKDCRAEQARLERALDPEKVREAERIRHSKNPDVKKASIKKWYSKNAENKKAKEKERYLKNSDAIKNAAKAYRQNNKEKVREWNGTRRALLKTSMPKWANREAIKWFYKESVRLTRETGIEHHVDHIIPLASKLVSGLHVEGNLQILQKKENLQKGNRFISQ